MVVTARYEGAALAAGCLVAAGLVVVATSRYGPGLTPDSMAYVSTAKSLASGGGFQDHADQPLVHFPPLYPMLLAPAVSLGATALSVVRGVNALCAAGIVVVGFCIVRHHISSAALRLAALAALVLAGPVLFAARYAWSEALFLLLLLAATYCLEQVLSTERAAWVVAAAGVVGLACLTRYAGAALILGGVISLLFTSLPRRRKVTIVAAFTVISGLPLGIWLVRNLTVAGTATGGRPPSSEGVANNAERALSGAGAWLVGDWVPRTVGASLVVALLLGLAALLRRSEDRGLIPLAAIAGSLLGGTVASASITAVDAFDDRLLSPLYVPLVILAFALLDWWATSWNQARVVAIAGVWLLAIPAIEVASQTVTAIQVGAGGYAHRDWQESEVMRDLRDQPRTVPLWTNAPAAVWFLLDEREAKLSPRRHAYRSPDTPTDDIAQLEAALDHGPVLLAWFDLRAEPYFLAPEEVATRFQVETVATAHDGEILAVRSPRRASGFRRTYHPRLRRGWQSGAASVNPKPPKTP